MIINEWPLFFTAIPRGLPSYLLVNEAELPPSGLPCAMYICVCVCIFCLFSFRTVLSGIHCTLYFLLFPKGSWSSSDLPIPYPNRHSINYWKPLKAWSQKTDVWKESLIPFSQLCVLTCLHFPSVKWGDAEIQLLQPLGLLDGLPWLSAISSFNF